jgi:phosphoenolpyruvate carboxykinase (GTP)
MWDGLKFSAEEFEQVSSIDLQAWAEELKLHDELFDKLSYGLPEELKSAKARLAAALAA